MQTPTVAAHIVLAALLGSLLSGCGSLAAPKACKPSATTPSGKNVQMYFGCGCFWHVQHAFVMLEMTELCRQGENVTSRTAYAGSTQTGPGGLVCYHNSANTADYGALGHAEVVSFAVPEAAFGAVADKFWQVCRDGERRDTQDAGGEYRSVIGLPGGMDSPMVSLLKQKAGSAELLAGSGGDGDTLGTGKVFVYDSDKFPAHTAEKYHQFHDDMMDSYGPAYNAMQKDCAGTECPGDQSLFTQ